MDRPTFAEVSSVTATDGDAFTAQLHPDWTIGGKPNGGYLLATMARAAGTDATHPHVIAASAQYLRAPEPGEARIEVELLRTGRSASQLRATLWQDEARCIEALLTTANLDPASEPRWSGGVPELGPASHADAIRLPGVGKNVFPIPIMDQVDLRIDPDTVGFTRGRSSGRGELRGWLALPGDEPFDPTSLLYAVDAFPPATMDIQVTGWVPTLELTVYVRALPAPGPVRVLHRAHLVDGGRVDEVCWVWDSRGRVVAHGTQLAGIRLT